MGRDELIAAVRDRIAEATDEATAERLTRSEAFDLDARMRALQEWKVIIRWQPQGCFWPGHGGSWSRSSPRRSPGTSPPSSCWRCACRRGQAGENTWREWLSLPELTAAAAAVAAHLAAVGYVDRDSGMLFIGPEAELRHGRRHFMDLMAVFTAPPELTVLHGRDEIGRTDPMLLCDTVDGPRPLLLGGRS